MIKLTPLQIETLHLIREGRVRVAAPNGRASRIHGGTPQAVSALVRKRLARWPNGAPIGNQICELTDEGMVWLTKGALMQPEALVVDGKPIPFPDEDLLAALPEACRAVLWTLETATDYPDRAGSILTLAKEHARDAAIFLDLARQAQPALKGTPFWEPREWVHLSCGADAPNFRQFENQAVELIEQQLRKSEG